MFFGIEKSDTMVCEIEYYVRIGESVSDCQKIFDGLIQYIHAIKIERFPTHLAFLLGAFRL